MLLDLLFHHEQGWWNTSHGTPPANLKFEPIRDGYVVKTTTEISSGILQVSVFASAQVGVIPHLGVSSGCNSVFKGVANASVRASSFSGFTSMAGVRSGGSSFAAVYAVSSVSGCRNATVSATALAVSWHGWADTGGQDRLRGAGVHNPTDEEVGAMIHFVRKRLTTRSKNDYIATV